MLCLHYKHQPANVSYGCGVIATDCENLLVIFSVKAMVHGEICNSHSRVPEGQSSGMTLRLVKRY